MAQSEIIGISKALYEELIYNSRKLAALEMAGVDNWSGYDYAMQIFHQDDEEE